MRRSGLSSKTRIQPNSFTTANDQRARDWAIARALEYTWYLWEDNSPPSSHGFFNVMMPGGEELTALFDRRGTWWSIRMERIVPMFWRDSSHLPH